MESTIASVKSTITTTSATAAKDDDNNNSIVAVAVVDLLVSFAEQNAFLYFNTHTNLRSLIQRRMFLETYDRENALQLVSDVYVPAVVREYNMRDKEKLHAHNIKTKYHDPVENRLNCRRLSIPLSANKLHAEVRQDIATRLLDWILADCTYLIKEEKQYDEMVSKRSSCWKNRRGRHYQK